MFTTNCSHLLSSPSTTSLLSNDLFFTREHFNLDFGMFSTTHSFLCCACCCFSDCVGFICLKRKWTYWCPNFGFFSLLSHSYCLFGEEMDVLMSKFRVFWSSYLLLCRYCIYVIHSRFLLLLWWCDVLDFSPAVSKEACSASFHTQIRLGSDYSLSRFIYILLRQCRMMNWLGDWFDNCINLRRFLHGLNPLSLMERGVTSTSGMPQQGGWKNTRVKRLRPDRPVGVLSKWEF